MGTSPALNNRSMNAIPIHVKRTDAELAPDPTRVLLRPFVPGDVPRLKRIVTGILAISDGDVGPLLEATYTKFSGRHGQIGHLFKERFRQLREVVSLEQELSEQRQLLIGAYFVSEFPVESEALFNPSMVADPDQQGLPPGALRFVMSLRATGDASISSIVFRTGIIHADHRIEIGTAACCVVEPSRVPNALYEKALFERKILELGLTNEHTLRVMQRLGDSFTEQELQSTIETELKEDSTPEGERTARTPRSESRCWPGPTARFSSRRSKVSPNGLSSP
jgi:hypothetical protein